METVVEAKVEKGKLVPLEPIGLPDGAKVKIRIELIEDRRKVFIKALNKLKGSIRGKVRREDWYEQAYLY